MSCTQSDIGFLSPAEKTGKCDVLLKRPRDSATLHQKSSRKLAKVQSPLVDDVQISMTTQHQGSVFVLDLL